MPKVISNEVSNLQAVSSFRADFNGCSAIITGKNRGGKTSFCKRIFDRCRGIKPPVVLKEGEHEGFQQLELDNGDKILWSFENKTAKGERLIYITTDQATGKEKRNTLTEKLMAELFPGSFDIDRFLTSTPAKQRKMLADLVHLDFTDVDDRHKVAYEDRTFANKKLDEAKHQQRPINSTLPTELINTAEIEKAIWSIDNHNKRWDQGYEKIHDPKEGYIKQKADNDALIKNLESQIKKLQGNNKQLDENIAKGRVWLEDPENKKKGEDEHFALNQKLQDAKDQNEAIKRNNEAIKQQEDFNTLDKDAKDKDAKVKEIELEKMEMIRGANVPEGFTFTDNGIAYNGLPLDKSTLASSEVYVAALKLAFMPIDAEPKSIRAVHFDASYLDKNSLAEVEKWADANDLQLFIELPDFDAGELRYELIEREIS